MSHPCCQGSSQCQYHEGSESSVNIYLIPPTLGIDLLAYRTDILHNMYTLRSRINSLRKQHNGRATGLTHYFVFNLANHNGNITLLCNFFFFFYQRMKMKGLKVEALFALIFVLTLSQT